MNILERVQGWVFDMKKKKHKFNCPICGATLVINLPTTDNEIFCEGCFKHIDLRFDYFPEADIEVETE